MTCTTLFTETAALVEKKLDALLPQVDQKEAPLFEAMRYGCLSGGKRLRPVLVLSTASMFGVEEDCALRTATAIECVHAYSLIHDDLPAMDNADLRRNLPTVHRAFDEQTAILAGDALLALAFEILADSDTHDNPIIRNELITGLAKAAGACGMVGGQMLDLMGEQEEFDQATITRLQRLKTGALIAFSCDAGAILGHTDRPHRKALQAYAHDVGLAFQIVDDILDSTGTTKDIGKPVRQDNRANKENFVSLLGLERAKQQAMILTEQAIQHLHVFGTRADTLKRIAEFLLNRKS